LVFDKESNKSISRSIVKIAVFGISLGLIVMILSVAIVTGFKNEIREKVIGFGSHIQILNYDSNTSYETEPVSKFQSFYPGLDSLPGIEHVQVFATKAGILKTSDQIQGVILKGIDKDFQWGFFRDNLLDGEVFQLEDSVTSNKIVISKYIADLLKLDVGDNIATYFVQDPPRMRRFMISGIYETSLTEFDQIFILADIRHIQKLNKWREDQVSGFEIAIEDFDKLEKMTSMVRNIAGYTFTEEGARLKVTNIRNKYPQIFDWLNLQNINVWVILILMLLVAGFNMVSGLLVLILERTNMIGILKSLGTENTSVRKIFLYQSAFLISRGLLWGNLIGLGLALLQKEFSIIKLDQASYYLETVPINLSLVHVLLLNAGTLIATIFMLILPTIIISRISPEKTIRYN
jgi:lipoprotein-releasing system permease protein